MVLSQTRREFLAGAMAAALASGMASTRPVRAATAKDTGPAAPDFVVIPTKVYPAPDAPDGLFPVQYRKILPATAPRARYLGFNPGTWTLKAGTVRREGARPLPVDIVFERDVPMTLRDGTTIYTDIFRPVGDEPVLSSACCRGRLPPGSWLTVPPD